MRRSFAAILLSGCVLLSMAVVAVVALAQGQAVSPWLEVLKLDGCELPCWIGITPGVTRLEEARHQVEATFSDTTVFEVGVQALLQDAQSRRSYRIVHKRSNLGVIVALDTGLTDFQPEAVIQRIVLRPFATGSLAFALPTLGDVQTPLGDALALRLGSGISIPTLVVLYRDQQVGVNFEDPVCHRVVPQQAIRSLMLVGPSFRDDPTWTSQVHPWRGFGRCYNLVSTSSV